MLDSQIYVVVLPTQQILGKMTPMVGKSNIYINYSKAILFFKKFVKI